MRLREYPERSLALLDGLAEELGIRLFPNLRLINATDGVFPLDNGYRVRLAQLLSPTQAAGQLPLADRHCGSSRLRQRRRRGAAGGGGGSAAGRALVSLTQLGPWRSMMRL